MSNMTTTTTSTLTTSTAMTFPTTDVSNTTNTSTTSTSTISVTPSTTNVTTQLTTTSGAPTTTPENSSTAAIVGGVVGGIVFLILVGLVIFLILRHRRRKKRKAEKRKNLPLAPSVDDIENVEKEHSQKPKKRRWTKKAKPTNKVETSEAQGPDYVNLKNDKAVLGKDDSMYVKPQPIERRLYSGPNDVTYYMDEANTLGGHTNKALTADPQEVYCDVNNPGDTKENKQSVDTTENVTSPKSDSVSNNEKSDNTSSKIPDYVNVTEKVKPPAQRNQENNIEEKEVYENM